MKSVRTIAILGALGMLGGDVVAQQPSEASASPMAPTSGTQAVNSATAEPSAAVTSNVPPAANPSARVNPHSPDPHGASSLGELGTLLTGSPFDSPQHAMQAVVARQGRALFPQSGYEPNASMPPGTIGILVQQPDGGPLAGTKVLLKGVRKSIEEGDKPFTAQTTTDPIGRAAFRDQPTDSSYEYEVVVERDGATYSSGTFRFSHQKGMIVRLQVFPVTTRLSETFVFSRALYAVEPRSDVLQIQALYRLHNASNAAWKAVDFPIRLPEDARAFQPGNAPGIDLREQDGAVLVSGTFTPGQQEFTYTFQVPNARTEVLPFRLPAPPNLVDAKIVTESSDRMGLSAEGFQPSIKTQSPGGRAALLVQRDYLDGLTPPASFIQARLTGMPPKSKGPVYASLIAGAIALVGLFKALSGRRSLQPQIAKADVERARKLLLDELSALEKAHRQEQLGPKTYEQAKKSLLDALARLEVTRAADVSAASLTPSGGASAANRAARS